MYSLVFFRFVAVPSLRVVYCVAKLPWTLAPVRFFLLLKQVSCAAGVGVSLLGPHALACAPENLSEPCLHWRFAVGCSLFANAHLYRTTSWA